MKRKANLLDAEEAPDNSSDLQIVQIKVHDEKGKEETFKFFRGPLIKHSSKFAAVFSTPGITAIELNITSIVSIEVLAGWLSYQHRRELENDQKVPDWTLVGMKDRETIYLDSFFKDDPLTCGTLGFLVYDEQLNFMADMAVMSFICASTYDIPRLRHDATDRLHFCLVRGISNQFDFNDIISHELIEQAYEGTDTGSPLRTILRLGFVAWLHADMMRKLRGKKGKLERMEIEAAQSKELKQLPAQFAADIIMTSLFSKDPIVKDAKRLKALHVCDFHGHKNDQERQQCEGSRINWSQLNNHW